MKYNGDDNKSGFWEQEKSRLEDKLVNKIFKCLIRFLIEVIVMTVLIVGINIFMNGMYLWGLPRINDIQSVNITYTLFHFLNRLCRRVMSGHNIGYLAFKFAIILNLVFG